MNIISQSVLDTGNYYCTWRTQNTVLKNEKLKKINRTQTRDSLGEELLFGEVGILNMIDKTIRQDLIIVLDDGWDVPYGLKPSPKDGGNSDYKKFGSMILDRERFPSFKGTAEKRLKTLSDKIKSMGYKGLGLWLAVQLPDNEADLPETWEEKFSMLNFADIKYVKFDWGAYCHDVRYREMLTMIAHMKAPGLKVEHSCPRPSFNYEDDEKYSEEITSLLSISDYFRVYDASAEFRHTTLISRCAETLKASLYSPNAYTIPNIEDPVYIGAALGFSIGAMRMFPVENDPSYSYLSKLKTPMTELKRALMWQRMAPPFPLNMTDFEVSDKENKDEYQYPEIPGNPWPYMSGKHITQTAPRIISRNMPLAKVKSANGIYPFILSSVNPVTKALSVFSAPRTIEQDIFKSIKCDVEVEAADISAPVGVFGKYKELTISFPSTVMKKKIFAQDLASDTAVNITHRVKRQGRKIIIDSELIEEIGLSIRECEEELPGLVIKLV